MFGLRMLVTHNNQSVLLRMPTKNDLPCIVNHFDSMKVHMYTKGLFGQSLESEEEWYERNRKDENSCTWMIQPEGCANPVGVTSLHHITSRYNFCSSGIIIWDTDWWGKGVASASHLARTYFAFYYLNRFVIKSSVRVDNIASRKALERVGYSIWGREPIATQRNGEWLESYHLMCFNPDKVNIYYPNEIPNMFVDGIERARLAMNIAKTEVQFP